MKIIIEGTEEEKKDFISALHYVDRGLSILIQEYLEDNNPELEEKATKYRRYFQILKNTLLFKFEGKNPSMTIEELSKKLNVSVEWIRLHL